MLSQKCKYSFHTPVYRSSQEFLVSILLRNSKNTNKIAIHSG